MKTIYYRNKIRSHLVTIVPRAPFTVKLSSKLRNALHFRYSIVIPRLIPRANTTQSLIAIVSTFDYTDTIFF